MKRTLLRGLALVCVIAVSVIGTRVVDAAVFGFGDKKGTLKIVREPDTVSTSSTTNVAVPGISTVIETKKDGGILLIRFAAQGLCLDNGANGNCAGKVTLRIDGFDVGPSADQPFMNSTGEGSLGFISLAIDRSKHALAKGPHTVDARFAVVDATDSFNLANIHMSVQAFQGPKP